MSCVHKSLHLKSDYKPDNLQMLLVCTLIMQRITRVVYDTPYKAGTYVHHTKNYQSSLLILHIRLISRKEFPLHDWAPHKQLIAECSREKLT